MVRWRLIWPCKDPRRTARLGQLTIFQSVVVAPLAQNVLLRKANIRHCPDRRACPFEKGPFNLPESRSKEEAGFVTSACLKTGKFDTPNAVYMLLVFVATA